MWRRLTNVGTRSKRLLYGQHRHPPLQNTQGRGTLSCGGISKTQSKGGPPGLSLFGL